MKYFVTLLLTTIILTASFAHAADAPSDTASFRVWIVFDTAYRNRKSWDEIQAVARATVRALSPGDRIRVVTTGYPLPRLLMLEQIGPDDPSRAEIIKALGEVRPSSSSDVSLAQAMQLPLSMIEKEDAKKSLTDLLLVLTDGRMDTQPANDLLAVHEKLKAGGAHVVVMGVPDSSSVLLLAAARGHLDWREISRFDPGQWLAQTKRSLQATPPEKTEKRPPDVPTPATHPAPAPQPEEPGKQVSVLAVPRGNTNQAAATRPGAPAPAVFAPPEVVPVPARTESNPSSPAKVLELSISIARPGEKTVEVPVSLPATPSALPPSPDTPTSRSKVEVPVLSAQSHPALPVSAAPAKPETTAMTPVASSTAHPTPIQRARRGWWTYWFIWGPASLLMCVIGGLVVRDLSRAGREARPTTTSHALNQQSSELMVHINGGERSMGNTQSLMQFSVGSAVGNSLRIQERGVEEQHLRVKRTRSGDWMVTNLSKKPVEINATDVGGGTTAILEFPASVKISDSASFSLFLRPLPVH